MRPTASTASTRTRHQQPRDNLFAPNLSRRPTARSTPKLDDEVLADPESEAEAAAAHSDNDRRGGRGRVRRKVGWQAGRRALRLRSCRKLWRRRWSGRL
ncbi:hypothetical protein BTJ68_13037 [Hortaea werneckii EXF-2000]|uniref:Uncharacterized protein n=1 Tax=Hortaea werneckii EXF-2000 TaxID=1157616 RepID=A0A1Z5STX6_HORWE|nr:hypothetical protein BTJ68_13037 [Hortaea werneckii EXF-2000]